MGGEIIAIAVAHDATCEKGDEWLFHGMAEDKEDLKGKSDTITENEVEDAKIGCVLFLHHASSWNRAWYLLSHHTLTAKENTMKIWDFPMDQPNVESRYLSGINVEHNPNALEGLCEICGKNDSEYLFNIGMTHHHLCGGCFKGMVEQFANAIK